MLHTTRTVILVIAALSAVCAFAQTTKPPTGSAADEAKNVACLMEGSFNIPGIGGGDVKDCMENKGAMTQAQFKSACESLARTTAMMGGAPGKVTYMGACPRLPIAVCDGPQGLSSYYYIASPSRGLSELKEGCTAAGGKPR
jgi:hypothetical protein